MALARMLKNTGHDVIVWSAIKAEIDEILSTGKHKNLPNMVIPEGVRYTTDIETAMADTEIVLMAVASAFIRSTTKTLAPFIKPEHIIVSVAKGLEAGTLFTMTDVITDELKKNNVENIPNIGALSGPTHAEEVSVDLPTTIVAAFEDAEVAKKVQGIFMNSCMRVYTNTDLTGIELCGALKNVIALGVGISTGLGYGDNAKAALITRGIAEIGRLGLAMGCEFSTFCGLAGIGDLIVTATSMHSRNNRCGMLIGQGVAPAEAREQVGMVVEGIFAIPAAMELSKKYNVELPIISTTNDIIEGHLSPAQGVGILMERDKKSEF